MAQDIPCSLILLRYMAFFILWAQLFEKIILWILMGQGIIYLKYIQLKLLFNQLLFIQLLFIQLLFIRLLFIQLLFIQLENLQLFSMGNHMFSTLRAITA